MSNTEYTNVNNEKRVKHTHDDKHNTKHNGSWFISAEKVLKKIFKSWRGCCDVKKTLRLNFVVKNVGCCWISGRIVYTYSCSKLFMK